MKRGSLFVLAIPAMLCICLAPLVAEGKGSVVEWLATPIAAPYAAIGPELLDQASLARSLGIPERLLVERLDEGALKRVPAHLLAAAIQQDVPRFASVLAIIAPGDSTLRDHSGLSALLRQGAILLRAGYRDTELRMIFSKATAGAAARGRQLSSVESAARAFNAAAVALDASIRFSLSPASRQGLAEALAISALPDLRFDAVLSLFIRARGLGLQADPAAAILMNGLGKGASIDALDREITRRASH
ncbi:MAG: hypothetical protein M0001_05395 [Treponema sp.]|nr:hypothetical protein [Treponema sp.]